MISQGGGQLELQPAGGLLHGLLQLGDVSGIALSGVSVKISTIKVPGEGEAIVPPQTVKPEEEPVVEEKAEEPVTCEPAQEPVVEEKAEEPVVEEPAQEPVVVEKAEEPAVREPAEVEDESFGENSDPENENTAE